MTSFNFTNYYLSLDDNLHFSTTCNDKQRELILPSKLLQILYLFRLTVCCRPVSLTFGILMPSPQITFECRFEYDELLLRIVLLHNAQLSLSLSTAKLLEIKSYVV